MRLLRYRRLGPRYEVYASIVAVLAASAAVIGVCLWALGQAP